MQPLGPTFFWDLFEEGTRALFRFPVMLGTTAALRFTLLAGPGLERTL